ncbi:MAG: histidine phosphatase family protein [Desulfotomaculaceae bacterium]|nr:histidine phosphatase family protein [Desulfotomaculaceae bacterium]MDD4767302.1 histidine phosphatase family protein [Desulfotomaculaceae bacterium]
MSCRIYMIRHGETVWNVASKLQGHANVTLSDNGRRQAELLGRRLAGLKFDGFYASDLARAYETAGIIAQYHNNHDIKSLPELREINFGRWEGFSINEIQVLYPKEIKQWWKTPLRTRLPGGESLGDVVKRTVTVVKNIVESRSGGNVLLVTHGGVIRSVVGTVLGMDLNEHWRLRQDNACLNIIDFPEWDKGILMLFNDLSHLEFPCDCLPDGRRI